MKFFTSLLCGLAKPYIGPVDPKGTTKTGQHSVRRSSNDESDYCPYYATSVSKFGHVPIREPFSFTWKSQRQKQKQSIAITKSDWKRKTTHSTAPSTSAAKSIVSNKNGEALKTICQCSNDKKGQVMQWRTRSSTLPLTSALGTIVTNATNVLDQKEDNRWKGTIFGPKYSSRTGYFPSNAVQLIDKKVGMQRTSSQRQVKKVNVPLVPDIPGMQRNSSPVPPPPSVTGQPCLLLGTNQTVPILNTGNNNSIATTGSLSRRSVVYGCLTPTHPMTLPPQQADQNSMPSMRIQNLQGTNSVNHSQNGLMATPTHMNGNNVLQTVASPARHRNSTGSNSSQTSSGFESMKSGMGQPYVNVTVHQLRGDSPPSRNSVHSSGSSSLGSLERLDESGYGSSGHINVAEMVSNGVPDEEVLAVWLQHLHYEEYLPLFVNAGYDLPTVARMTPEDLTAIGITKPGHRKRLTTEIHKLHLPDPWPETKPTTLREWLSILKLSEYVPLFESQGFTNVDQLGQLTWEDYEDFGVKKLGHLKKLILASKKLKEYRQQQLSTKTGCGSTAHDTNVGSSDLLVINVPPSSAAFLQGNQSSNRTTAEVRPYSHLPAEMLSTFHQQQQQCSPRHCSNGSTPYRSAPSPTHRAYVNLQNPNAPYMDQQHYFQNYALVTTEAVIHDRPRVTVKPLLSMAAKSRENLETMEEMKGGNSPLIQSPRHRQPQSIFTGQNCYIAGSSNDLLNGRTGNRPTSTALLSNDIMCRSAPQPGQDPPQKPPIGPLGRPGAVFQLSINPLPRLGHVMDENCSTDELSPAPSMDEFPPPPSPILCMESIKNLRTVREHHPHSASVASDDDSVDLDLKQSCSTTGTLVRRRIPAEGQHDASGMGSRQTTTSTASIESNSSTETLPFANENVGTIRQRGQATQAPTTTPVRKPHVNEVFVNGQAGISNPNSNGTKPGNVLNDIGSMLQDLTDQLDALLKEPSQHQQQ